MSGLIQNVLLIVMFLTAVFLILLVLVQRGKGGGLAGAFGGMGGQSAFGTKAGDLFTKVTVAVATFWIILCMFTVYYLGSAGGSDDLLSEDFGGADVRSESVSAPPETEGASTPAAPAPEGTPAPQDNPGQP